VVAAFRKRDGLPAPGGPRRQIVGTERGGVSDRQFGVSTLGAKTDASSEWHMCARCRLLGANGCPFSNGIAIGQSIVDDVEPSRFDRVDRIAQGFAGHVRHKSGCLAISDTLDGASVWRRVGSFRAATRVTVAAPNGQEAHRSEDKRDGDAHQHIVPEPRYPACQAAAQNDGGARSGSSGAPQL
jgi:hypothetical protein